MNFEEIKNMNKKEFEQFIFKVQSSNQRFCVRCGNFTLDRITFQLQKMAILQGNYAICVKTAM